MAHLTSLPNELLLHIFTACPTVQSAALLSGGSSRLHNVWIAYHEHIVTSILTRDLSGPVCGDAMALAKDEARLMSSSPSGARYASSAAFVPRLIFHLDAATRVGAQYVAWTKMLKTKHDGHVTKTAVLPALSPSYYMTRQLVLSYHFPEQQAALRDELETAPLESLAAHLELAEFMYNCVDEQGTGLLGLPEDRFTTHDGMRGYPAVGAWKYTVNLLLRTYATRRLSGQQPEARNVHLKRQFELCLRV